jgi:hypothetical protein
MRPMCSTHKCLLERMKLTMPSGVIYFWGCPQKGCTYTRPDKYGPKVYKRKPKGK